MGRGQARAALAEGADRAAERGAAAAAGGAPLHRGGRLAARAAAAALLDVAAPVDPAVDGPQLHHPPGPRHQHAHHARAHLLLPHGHRGGTILDIPFMCIRTLHLPVTGCY